MNTLRLALLALSCTSLFAQNQFREDPGGIVTPATRSVFIDLDHDGDHDLLQRTSAGLVLQVNDGAGTFSPVVLTPSPNGTDLATGDFDGDGDEDAILMAFNPSRSLLVRNNGPASTTLESLSSSTVRNGNGGIRLSVADLDGDNDLDFITSPTAGNPAVFLNDGSGFFHHVTNAFPATVILGGFVATGDFDADGDVDHLIGNRSPTLFLNDGSANFAAATPTSPGIGSQVRATVGDFNGDGIDDVLAISSSGGRVYLGDPVTPLVERPGALPISLNLPFGVITTDVDDDGDLDAIASGVAAGTLSILVNDGTGVFTNESALRLGFTGVATNVVAGDVDGDGDPDLYATRSSSAVTLRNHHREVTVPTQPTTGGTLTIELSYAPGYGTGLGLALPAIGPEAPARLPSPFGTVWIDPAFATALPFVGIVGTNGDATVNVAVPNEPGLVGLAFLTQALIFEPFDPSVNERLTGFRRVIIR